MKVEQTCAEAQRASRALAGPPGEQGEVLFAVADALRRRSAEILAENDEDVRLARENRLADALVDRLLLDEDRLRTSPPAVRAVAALPDPSARSSTAGVSKRRRTAQGPRPARRRRRDLRGAAQRDRRRGRALPQDRQRRHPARRHAALHTNRILAEVVQGAVIETGLPREAVSYLGPDRGSSRNCSSSAGTSIW